MLLPSILLAEVGYTAKCYALIQGDLEDSQVLSAECDQDIKFRLAPLTPEAQNTNGALLKVARATEAEKLIRLLSDCELEGCIHLRGNLEARIKFSKNTYSGKVKQVKKSPTFGIFEEKENSFEIICTSLGGIFVLIEPYLSGPGYTHITTTLVTGVQCNELEKVSMKQSNL